MLNFECCGIGAMLWGTEIATQAGASALSTVCAMGEVPECNVVVLSEVIPTALVCFTLLIVVSLAVVEELEQVDCTSLVSQIESDGLVLTI